MSRILIISEEWPPPEAAHEALAAAIAASGREAVVMTNGPEGAAGEPGVLRVPVEPRRSKGFLFGLRNALLFGAAANPGNYALLRDTLHLHLQEVLYDAVVLICRPQIYLKLGHWIARTFGIPVWMHLPAGGEAPGEAGFSRWMHRRLRKEYLASAALITATTKQLLTSVRPAEAQLIFLADGLRFIAVPDGTAQSAEDLLRRIIRKKQHS